MKYLYSIFIVFAFALTSCAPAMESPPEENSMQSVSSVAVQEGTPSNQTGTKVEVVGGNEASLREFIKQWITPGYPTGSDSNMTVYIGSTPKDIPYDLPVPEDAGTIGSITGGWMDYMLLYDTSLDTNAIHEFYVKNLADKGWQVAATDQGLGGFVPQSDLYSNYCQKDGKAYLSVETPPVSDTKTGIRLSLDTDPDPHLCDPSTTNPGFSAQNLIPSLKAPKDAMVQSSGAGSSDRDAEISATITSKLSPSELVELYNEQLLSAGWKMQTSGSGEGAAWSNWTFTDVQGTNWLGSLFVIQTSPDRDSQYALVRIEKE